MGQGLLHRFQKAGKNKQLNAVIQKIEMNASNNYKDAAQSGLREFQEMLREQERIVFFMKMTMLGTGNAMVTDCYNTCFMINDEIGNFLIDGGGGNTILRQLKNAGYDCTDIDEIFVTHKHIDHILGIIWVVRKICQSGMQRKKENAVSVRAGEKNKSEKEVNVYGHEEVIELLKAMLKELLWENQWNYVNEHTHFIVVKDGETRQILGRKVTFFDIHSTKDKQFGFCMELDNGKKFVCCGDEPYNPCVRAYVENSEWLLHEAFCLHAQADIFGPYEKHHSTVKDACETAEALGVRNLLLYHTEDRNLPDRKRLYTEEGSRYFQGKLYVPEDLEVLFI